LKRKKELLSKELATDNARLSKLRSTISTKESQAQGMIERLRDLEDRKDAYDRVIEEGVAAYSKITDITGKLVNTINKTCDDAENRFLGGSTRI